MQDWQQRVLEERDQLHGRLAALDKFIEAPDSKYAELYFRDKSLLIRQRFAMRAYLSALNDRIDRFMLQEAS